MAGSPTGKATRPAKAEGESARKLKGLLSRIRSHLATSETPVEDWRQIRQFVEKGFGRFVAPEQPSPRPRGDRRRGAEDTPMPAPKPGPPTAPSIRSAKLLELLGTIVDDPEKWLSTPSVQFGGRRPGDLVGTPEEGKLLDLLHAVDQGLF
jgi:hypothetical protein